MKLFVFLYVDKLYVFNISYFNMKCYFGNKIIRYV